MRYFVLLCTALLVACHNPTAPEGEVLQVSARDSMLTIRNMSPRPVRYLVEGAQYVPLADLYCTPTHPCGSILQGNSAVVIPYREILGYTVNERAAVISYTFDAAAYYPNTRQRVTVELR